MIDRRKLIGIGLGAGASLAAPGLALAAARHGKALRHGPSRHSPAHHGRAHHHADARLRPDAMRRLARSTLSASPRRIVFDNLHTDEKLDAVYWADGEYLPDALAAVNKVLRDFRTGDVHPIDPDLLDVLVQVRAATGSTSSFQVISGYRSPATNAVLHEQSAEVAKHSFHMDGMAIDVRLEDVALYRLHEAGVVLGRGGIGYYPELQLRSSGRGACAPLARRVSAGIRHG